ncbi:MAG: type IV pilin [Candidatus Nanohaloarchaea archaeon]
MQKGVTPVVAVVMLVTITIASAGTVWKFYDGFQSSVNPNTDIVKMSNLYIESCWKQSGNTWTAIRNGNAETINTGYIDVFLNGTPTNNYDWKKQYVSPQETVRLEITAPVYPVTTITLSTTNGEVDYTC